MSAVRTLVVGGTGELGRIVTLGAVRALSVLVAPIHPGGSQMLRMAVIAQDEGQEYRGASYESQIGVAPLSLERWAIAKLQGLTPGPASGHVRS